MGAICLCPWLLSRPPSVRLRQWWSSGLGHGLFLSYLFAPSFAAPFAIAVLAAGLRVIGVLTTCQQIKRRGVTAP
jgi:hypothetical protein